MLKIRSTKCTAALKKVRNRRRKRSMPKIKRSFTESDDAVILHYAVKNTTRLDRRQVSIDWNGFDFDIKRAVFSSGREYFRDDLHDRARYLLKKNNKRPANKAIISLLTDDEDDNHNNYHDYERNRPNNRKNNNLTMTHNTTQSVRVKQDDDEETNKCDNTTTTTTTTNNNNNNNNHNNKENDSNENDNENEKKKNNFDSFDLNLSGIDSDSDSDSVFAKPKQSKSRPNDSNVPRITNTTKMNNRRRSLRIKSDPDPPTKRFKMEQESSPLKGSSSKRNTNPAMNVFDEFLKIKSKAKFCMELNTKEKELVFLLSSSTEQKEHIWEHIKTQATESLRTFITRKEENIPLFEMDRIKHLVRPSRIKSFETMIKEFKKYLNTRNQSSIENDDSMKSLKDLSRSLLNEFSTYKNSIDSEDTKICQQIQQATDKRKQKIQNLLDSFLD